eukprot:855783-Pyramimonas_sp.AAC.1
MVFSGKVPPQMPPASAPAPSRDVDVNSSDEEPQAHAGLPGKSRAFLVDHDGAPDAGPLVRAVEVVATGLENFESHPHASGS